MTNIPIIRIPFSGDDMESLSQDWATVLRSGMLTMGKFTTQFENLFKEFTGARYAVAVNSGTSALEVMIRALGIEGKSIIVPTNTFLASALAVAHAGNKVIFADSDRDTLSLDVADVERRIDDNTAAVMVVHIGGIVSPAVADLKALCGRRGLYLIEDCAHAHGSTLNGRHAGLLGTAGGFSFFPTKDLTTGEGGIIVTDDETLANNAAMLRNQGKNPSLSNHISEMGHNWRMSEITAVMGVQQVNKAAEIVADRTRIARYYDEALREFPGLKIVAPPPNTTSSYYKYIAFLDPEFDRAEIKRAMREDHTVSLPGEVYADLCHTEPVWEGYTYCGKRRREDGQVQCAQWPGCGCAHPQAHFPEAEYISQNHICLPMYPGLTEDELKHVVTSLDQVMHPSK